jgi:hypothetical protein
LQELSNDQITRNNSFQHLQALSLIQKNQRRRQLNKNTANHIWPQRESNWTKNLMKCFSQHSQETLKWEAILSQWCQIWKLLVSKMHITCHMTKSSLDLHLQIQLTNGHLNKEWISITLYLNAQCSQDRKLIGICSYWVHNPFLQGANSWNHHHRSHLKEDQVLL